MENKKKLIIIIAVFVMFMCGAAFLYNKLGKNVDRQQLITQGDEAGDSDTAGNGNNDIEQDNTGDASTSPDTNTSVGTESEQSSGENMEENAEYTAASGAENNQADEEKMLAPDFTVYDIDGNVVRLSDYVGKPIVLNFWASWCGPCKSEMPEFEEKYKELKDEVQFLMVNMTDGSRETVDVASTFINEQGYTFPVLYDTDINAAYLYSVYSLPTTFFIDEEGYIVAYAAGAIDGEILQKGIDMVLAE